MQAKTIRRTLALTALASFSALTSLAQAAPADLERVEISGRLPGEMARTDVRRVCPGVDTSLLKAMTPTVLNYQREGVVTVSFRLQGDDVQQVRTRGGPQEYHDALRRAMRRLDCSGNDSNQLFALQVSFRTDEDEQGHSRQVVALID